jgi:hypothetical protein
MTKASYKPHLLACCRGEKPHISSNELTSFLPSIPFNKFKGPSLLGPKKDPVVHVNIMG